MAGACRLLHLSPRAGREPAPDLIRGRIPSEAERSEPPGRSARGRVRGRGRVGWAKSLAGLHGGRAATAARDGAPAILPTAGSHSSAPLPTLRSLITRKLNDATQLLGH